MPDLHSDIVVPGAWSLILSTLVAVPAGLIAAANDASGIGWGFGVGWATMALSFGVVAGRKVISEKHQRMHEEVLERKAEKMNQAPQRGTYEVKAKLEESPRQHRYTTFDIENPWGLHRFCGAVSAGDCAFSGRAAAKFGLERDWGTIRDEFSSRGLVTVGGTRSTPKLTPPGKAIVRKFATTPPPQD
jgi:hypothetical protein